MYSSKIKYWVNRKIPSHCLTLTKFEAQFYTFQQAGVAFMKTFGVYLSSRVASTLYRLGAVVINITTATSPSHSNINTNNL